MGQFYYSEQKLIAERNKLDREVDDLQEKRGGMLRELATVESQISKKREMREELADTIKLLRKLEGSGE